MSDNLSVADAVAAHMANQTQAEPEQLSQDAPQPEDQEQQAVSDSELPDDTEEQPLDADSEADEGGEPLDEHDEPDGEDDEEPLYTVVINGKQEQVNLEELQHGYMRQSDYTRSKQAVAENGKALQAQAEQVNSRLGNMDAQLAAIDQAFFGTQPEQPPVDLMRSDPVAYEEQNRFFQQWHLAKQNLDGQRQAIVEQRTKETQDKWREAAQTEAQAFIKEFDIKDDAQLSAKIGELQHFATTNFGYSAEELSKMIDHRAYKILDRLKFLEDAYAGATDKTRLKTKRGKVKPISSGRGQKPQKKGAREMANQRFDQTVAKTGTGYSRNAAVEAAVAAYTAKD